MDMRILEPLGTFSETQPSFYTTCSSRNLFFDNHPSLFTILVSGLFIFHPNFVLSAYHIHQLTFSILFVVLVTYFNIEFIEAPSRKKSVFWGMVYGIALLVAGLFLINSSRIGPEMIRNLLKLQ